MTTSRGDETKRRALDAALELHRIHGSEGFTIHAIASSSGVSVGSLYHHFGSMEGLSAALYTRCLVRLLERLGAALGRSRSARSGVERVVRAYLEFTRDHVDEARFIHGSAQAAFVPANVEAIDAAKHEALAPLVAFARTQVASGRIVPLPEPLLETLWIGVPAEIARRWLAGVEGVDLDQAISAVPSRVFASMAADPARSRQGD